MGLVIKHKNHLMVWIWYLVVHAVVLIPMDPTAGQETKEVYVLDGHDWHRQTQVDPDSPEGRLMSIRRALAEDRPDHALELADPWIEHHRQHTQIAEAFLLRGDAKAAMGDYYKALYDYEFAVREYPSSPFYETLLQRQLQMAKIFASGVKRKFFGLRLISIDSETEELLIRIQERAPGSSVGEQASLILGDFYFDRKQMNNALVAYEMFLVNYPDSDHRPTVMRRMIEASLEVFKGPRYDPTGLIEAAQRIKDFEKEYPLAAQQIDCDRLLARIDELLAEKMFQNGLWYEGQAQPVSAGFVYRRLLRDYSHTQAGRSAVERLAAMGLAASTSGPAARDQVQGEVTSSAGMPPAASTDETINHR